MNIQYFNLCPFFEIIIFYVNQRQSIRLFFFCCAMSNHRTKALGWQYWLICLHTHRLLFGYHEQWNHLHFVFVTLVFVTKFFSDHDLSRLMVFQDFSFYCHLDPSQQALSNAYKYLLLNNVDVFAQLTCHVHENRFKIRKYTDKVKGIGLYFFLFIFLGAIFGNSDFFAPLNFRLSPVLSFIFILMWR